MIIYAEQPRLKMPKQILIDGEDITSSCHFADDLQGVAYCGVRVDGKVPAISNDFGISPGDCALLVKRTGKVEFVY
jgi:hypothetical protein